MIAVMFEYRVAEEHAAEYQEHSARMRKLFEQHDGALSIESYESKAEPGKYLALGFFRDEESVKAWRNLEPHRVAQSRGRAGVFLGYRLRMATVTRDYGFAERGDAPEDSRRAHE